MCFGICQDELPGFAYFGTEYSFEVRSSNVSPSWSPNAVAYASL